MSEERIDLVNEGNAKYHGQATEYKLRYPRGTAFFEDIQMEKKYLRIGKSVYIDPDHVKTEFKYVWKNVWQFACTEKELPNPGDFVTYDIGDQGYLIVRQTDGSIRAYHNTCQHRGNRLAEECGSAKNIRCPFHGWAWKLDGSLQVIPDRHTFESLDGDLSLRAVQCDTWAGLVFIHPNNANTISLADFLGPVIEQLAPYKLEDMQLIANVVQPLSSNWKTVVEAFVEVYHVNGIHPQFLAASDDVNSAMEILSKDFGHSRAIIPFGVPSPRLASYSEADIVREYVHTGGALRGTEIDLSGIAFDRDTQRGKAAPVGEIRERYENAREFLIDRIEKISKEREVDLSGLTRDQYVDDWHYYVFPNLVFNISAAGFLLLSMRPHATDPDKMSIQTMVLQKFSEAMSKTVPVAKREYAEEGTRSYGLILDQDYTNVVLTQHGMHSDGYEASRLSQQEVRVAMVRKTLDRFIEEGQRDIIAKS